MKANREILEDHLEKYQAQLRSLKSYIKELNNRTSEYGTDREQFEQDLLEAEHNVKYYEGEVARVKKELAGLDKGPRTQKGADTILPSTVKQGVGSLILSSVGFVAGALFGSRLKSRRSGKEAPEEKRENSGTNH